MHFLDLRCGRLAKAYAKLGKIASAKEESGKASGILSARRDDAANAMGQRVRAIAYSDLAEAHAMLATASSVRPASAAQDWSAARDMYRRELNILEDLKNRGILDAEEVLSSTKCAKRSPRATLP